MLETAFFVSKRLQKVAAAIICIMLMQVLVSLSSCTPELAPMATRVAISR